MNLSQLKFDINDVVKICSLVVGALIFRNDIVAEIRSNKVFDSADKQVINYRLDNLEERCGVFAIKPEDVSVKTFRESAKHDN